MQPAQPPDQRAAPPAPGTSAGPLAAVPAGVLLLALLLTLAAWRAVEEAPAARAPLAVLAVGLLSSLLLFAVAWLLVSARGRALASARRLQEGEARYRALFELGLDGVVVLDPDTAAFLDFNDRACAQLGYTREEFQRLSIRDVDATETAAQTAARIRAVVDAGHQEFEAVHRDKRGGLHDVLVTARWLEAGGQRVYHCVWRDVTAQKRAEEERRREERRFHSYFDLPLMGAAITSPERGWLTVNDRLCAMLGYTREELQARTWTELTHPEDVGADAAYFAEMMAGRREAYTAEKRYLRKDGATLYARLAVQCVRDPQGRVEYFAALLDDIGARKREEQLVRARLALMDDALTCGQQELLVRSLDQAEGLTGSRIGFFHFVEADERTLSLQAWSTRTARDSCRAAGEGVHEPVDQAGVWADAVRERRPVVHDDYAALVGRKGLPPGHAELGRELVVPVLRQGRVVAVLGVGNKATSYSEADVTLLSRFADLAWDVVERKLAQDRLREGDERFAAAFERAPMVMLLSRLEDGRILDVNQRFVELSGRAREEVVGRTTVEIGWISEAERARAHAALLADGRQAGVEIELRARGGRAFRARFWGELLTAGGERCLLSIVQDVTAEQALQRQLAQAQRLESVGRLAGGVAHDFNNILSVILGHADLLLERAAPQDPLREDLAEIRDAARRAAEVTRQLLVFARQQAVEPRVLDLNEAVAGMLKMLRRLIGEDIDLQWTPGYELARVRIDPAQVDQLLANLCVNGRDAIEGVGRIAIQTANVDLDGGFCARHAGLTPGRHVRLTVSDDGAGIDPAVLPHVFEPFFTTKERRGGTGLGLATVYGIVAQNGGAIEVESAPGQGAAFRLYLPAAPEPPVERQLAPAPASPGGHETVLLVEDEAALLRLCSGLLADLGYHVLAARGPAEAVRLAAQHAGQVQLLLTDVVMPGMSGRDLATMLQLGHPGLRCLYMSGHGGDTLARYGLTGRDGVLLQKPFSREELAAKVRQALAPAPPRAAGTAG